MLPCTLREREPRISFERWKRHVSKKTHNPTAYVSGESQIPKEAGKAFANARDRAFKSGQYVVVSKDSQLVRVSPTGERKVVGQVASSNKPVIVHLKKGVKTTIKWKKSRD